jgi:hypothetical protein
MPDKVTAIEKQDVELLNAVLGSSRVYRQRLAARNKKSLNFDEYPVDIVTFIEHHEYLNLKGIVWESVKEDLKEIFSIEKMCLGNKFSPFQEVVLDEAIGAGKSFFTSLAISYIVYRLLCLKNPQKYYGLAPGSLLAVMNMSPTATQAKNVVFGEIKARIDCSEWFKEHGGLDDKIKSVLRFDKGITILPGNSSEAFPLGYNLIAWVMDEGAFYTDTPEHDVAQEIYYALMRRSQSRFRDRWLGVMISSPRYVDDFIERKMTESRIYPEVIYSKRRAIWEAKPEYVESVKKKETFELDEIPLVYKKTFEDNPDKAWRDLGARPSLVLEPYFKQWRLVEEGLDSSMAHPMDENGLFFDWFKGNASYLYYAHIDLALRTDACGVAVAHKEDDTVIVDFMLRIKSRDGKEIDLAEVRGIIYKMMENGFNFGKVTYDQFQSAESIQELNKKGIISEQLSVDKDLNAYETLKEMIYSGRCKYYKYEPFIMEMKRLELVKGKKVDHPAKGSKDVTDAVAGAVFNAVSEEGSRMIYFNIL